MSYIKTVKDIKGYVIKIEFQVCGLLHAHFFLWVEEALLIDVEFDDDVYTFIDHYITGKIPLDTDYSQDVGDVVIKLQSLAHSAYCR